MEFALVSVIVGALGSLLGLVIGRYIFPAARAVDQVAFAALQADAQREATEAESARSVVARVSNDLQASVRELAESRLLAARLDERLVAQSNQISELTSALGAAVAAQATADATAQDANQNAARLSAHSLGLQDQLTAALEELATFRTIRDGLVTEAKTLSEEVARLNERLNATNRELAALRAQDGKLQDTLKLEFENIAARVLKTNATELSEQSGKQIASILDPLKERIQEFQVKVETTYDSEKREVLALKEQIRHVTEASQNLGVQADGLAKALKGDAQLRGRWGEMVLDRILQTSGLTEGREYITQGRGLALRNEDAFACRGTLMSRLRVERSRSSVRTRSNFPRKDTDGAAPGS